MQTKLPRLMLCVCLLAILAACAGGSSTAETIEISEAVFARGLDEQMQPVDPRQSFAPQDTVYLSLTIQGRPRGGIVQVRFFWRETFIAEAAVDLADVNSNVVVSVGENTYVGVNLTNDQPFPISDWYQARVYYDDQFVQDYAFQVVPPAEAIPTNVKEVSLGLGVDESYHPIDETSVFAPEETVHLVGRGDLGWLSWFQAEWYVGGQLDEAGTRSFTLEENVPDTGFYFSYQPEAGWPPGEHLVALSMNDQVIGRYPFLVISSGGSAPLDETTFWEAFPLPEDAEMVPVVEGVDMAFATNLPAQRVLDLYGAWLRQQGWERQPPPEGVSSPYPFQVWRKENFDFLIEIQGPDEAGRAVAVIQLQQSE